MRAGIHSWFSRWPEAWRHRRFRIRLIATSVLLGGMLASIATFLQWVEQRPGVVINDPLLHIVGPVDLTWLIFGLIYLSLIVAIVAMSREPERLLLAMLCYSLLAAFRIMAMFLLPLDPPATAIPLHDPFVQLFGSGKVLMRDLFFSGHTSTLLLLALTAGDRRLRALFFIGTIVVGCGVIVHHAHYAVDVLVAPFACVTAYRLALLITRRIDPGSNVQ